MKQRYLADIKNPKSLMDQQFRKSMMSSQLVGSKFAKLQDQGNLFTNKIKLEQEKIKALDIEIYQAEKTLQQKRDELMRAKKQVIGKDENSLLKKIKIYQIKIDQLKSRQNELTAKHAAQKQNINFLREERCIFENISNQLEVDLLQNKNELREILNESDITMKSIIEAKQKLLNAKRDTIISQRDFDKEIQAIYKILNQENKSEKIKEIRKKLDKSPKSNQSDDSDHGEEQQAYLTEFEDNLYRQAQKKKNQQKFSAENAQHTKLEVKNNNQQFLKVQKHEEIFNILKKDTGQENINAIKEFFIHQEEKNFSLLKYINAQSDDVYILLNLLNYFNQLEALVKQKKSLVEEKKQLLIPKTNENDPKLQKMESIQKEIQTLQKKDEIFEQKEKELMKILNALKISIPIIFERIGCNNEEYLKEMGDLIVQKLITKNLLYKKTQNIADINENNILQFLGVIEKRTNEILQMYNDVFGNIYDTEPMEKKKSSEEQNNIVHESEFMKTCKFKINKLDENFTESLKFDKEAEIKNEKEFFNEAKQEINKMLGKPEIKKATKKKF